MEENKFRNALLLVLGALLVVFLVGQSSSNSMVSRSVKKDVEKAYQACQGLQNKEQCYAKTFDGLTRTTNMAHAFEVLRELQKKDQEARGCHFIAHSISTAETEKDASKWREVMNSAPQDCSYGAAHGALEVYASTFPEGKLPREEFVNICNNPDTNNCTHILGHLLLIETENDIDEAAGLCHTLPHDYNGIFECVTGVFMERITALNLVTHGLVGEEALNWPARVPELEALCREQVVGSIESLTCWKEITHTVIVRERNDTQRVINFCESAPGEEETRQCIDHALGIMTSGYNFDLSRMGSICESKAKALDFKNRCHAHLVSAVLSTTPQESQSAVSYCSNVEAKYQKDCFSMIGNSLYLAREENKTLLSRACREAPSEFKRVCEQGGPTDIIFHFGN